MRRLRSWPPRATTPSTMRSVAAALNTGPASLYADVVNKADIDELLIGRLCAQLTLPEPDPTNSARADT